jgi:hypothetical protein
MSNIETVRCKFGQIDIQIKKEDYYQKLGNEKLAGKIGVCDNCNRKWIEKVPEAKKNVLLEITVVANNVTSCDNVLTD